jgi:type IV pilus assembly protein PilB
MKSMKRKRLGEVLSERGHISPGDLAKALAEQQGRMMHLGEVLLQRNLVPKSDLLSALHEVTGVEYADCSKVNPSAELLKTVPGPLARRCRAIPVRERDKTLTVVMAEPQNLRLLEELQFRTGLKIQPKFGFQSELLASIERLYGAGDPGSEEQVKVEVADDLEGMEFLSASSHERNVQVMREMQQELLQRSKTTPAVHLVAMMIKTAIGKRASDIHVEPQQGETTVRFRVDGVLREFQKIPRALQNTVASRVKILSDMDIAERRAPQDGRFMVRLGPRRIDLRVSTLPTQYGEKVVMRLLEGDSQMKDFSALGVPDDVARGLEEILRLPQGFLLVTGPTGSGKSTTLYTCLRMIRRPAVNVITVEDPVEYVLPGLTQVQVNVKAGLTFASCLRSVLRQDPDVVMVGEIRDKETAEIAIKAAQTGHLVLSTLHTNDSVSAVTRLLDLGVPGFQIADALTAVVAQRLVRRLCDCKYSTEPNREYVNSVMIAGMTERPTERVMAGGCEKCDFTGYRGRIGIYELLSLNEPIRQAIRQGNGNEEVRTLARHAGMKFMYERGLELVKGGITGFEEIKRVVPVAQAALDTCEKCGQEVSENFAYCPHCGSKRLAGQVPFEAAVTENHHEVLHK